MNQVSTLSRSDLEPEVPHTLLVRLNQVGTILRPVLDYAGEGTTAYESDHMYTFTDDRM